MRILAALALLMHLCWPFVGQLRAAPAEALQVICTLHGAMTVPAAPAPDTDLPSPACALCSAAAVAITTHLSQPPTLQAPARHALERGEASPRLRADYSPARPRGPPDLS